MNIKKTAAGVIAAGALTFGATDAAVLKEKPLERIEQIGEERVEAKQIGNRVETSFPWKDQEGFKVVVDLGEPTIDERIKDKRKKEVVTEVVDLESGEGFKVDILLNEKPDTNVFCQTIEGAEDYDFFYQPPLTEEEIKEGAERPENVVGSYAVYHKTLKNNRAVKVEGNIWDRYSTSTQQEMVEQNKLFARASQDGKSLEWFEVVKDYATGKVMHIYRPQVWSLSDPDNKLWAELSYSDAQSTLCVTAPQEFIENAEYPVRIDPTFGYTSAGASGQQIAYNEIDEYYVSTRIGNEHTTVETGTLNSVSAYLGGTASGVWGGKAFVNDKDSAGSNSHGQIGTAENTGLSEGAPEWSSFTLAGQSVSVDTYILSVQGNPETVDGNSDGTNIYYDTATSRSRYFELWEDDSSAYSSPENPWVTTPSLVTRQFSIYATYTASGGGSSEIPQSEFWF